MTDHSAFETSELAGAANPEGAFAKKPWNTPTVIIGDVEETRHAANTVSDGTGNLYS